MENQTPVEIQPSEENLTPNVTKISLSEIELEKFKEEIENLAKKSSVTLAVKVLKENKDSE